MTVALLLAAAPDRLSAMTQPYRQPGDRRAGDSAVIDGVGGRLLDAGVRRVEVAMCADAADGLRAVAATARRAGEPVLVCTAARVLATPGPALAALLASRIAHTAAARGLAPNTLAIAAFALTGCAAAWFAAGSRSGLIAGALLLCAALPVRQARALLPAGGVAAAAFGGWLDAVSGAAGEFAVYAGLAVGWSPARPRQAWELATAAMILLAVRLMADACYASAVPPRPQMRGPGHPVLRLAGQSIALPAGERALLIAVTAPVWGPRTALI